MPVTIVGTPTISHTSTASPSVSHTVTAGTDFLVALIGVRGDRALSAVAYGGASMTQRASVARGTVLSAYIYDLAAPTAGTANFTATVGTSANETFVALVNLDGVDSTTPRGSPVTGQSNTTSSSSLAVTASAGGLVIDLIYVKENVTGGPPTLTIGAGQTTIPGLAATGNVGPLSTARAGGSTEPGATSVTMSWSLAVTADYAHAALPYNEAAAGGGGAVPQRMLTGVGT